VAKSLDQFEYEMQHQRFLKALSEALYEIHQDGQWIGTSTLNPATNPDRWIDILAGAFVQKCEEV
jgi:hypothetical protein